jgi:transposase
MKALTIKNKNITHNNLLQMAEKIPGAWIGLRIAAILLILEGWKSSQVAKLFGVTRWSAVQWIQKVNNQGISGLEEGERSGRPARINLKIQNELEHALQKSPKDFGLKRNHWDGIVVTEYLEKTQGVHIEVRQAQRWIRKLGFSLRQPVYQYVQATNEGVAKFRKNLKKTP